MNKRYILYIKKNCPFCVKALELLERESISFSTIAFDNRPQVLNEIKSIYQWNTVPMVFEASEDNNYKLVGGYTDLVATLEKNSNG